MSRRIVFLVIIMGVASLAFADPQILVPEQSWDFGHVPQHGTYTHDYMVKNIGTDTLKIIKVKPGWGCTSAPIQKNVLAPGESTVVELIFKTKSYKTKISKYATIYSNDPDQPTVKIHMSSQVYPEPDSTLPYRLSPDRVTLSKDDKEGKIVFENVGDSKLFIEPAGVYLEGFKIDVKNDDPKPGQTSELKIKWDDEFDKENMERSVTFHVSGSESGIYRFSVPLMIQGTDPTPQKTPSRPNARSQTPAKPRKTVQRPLKKPVKSTDDAKAAEQTDPQKTESAGKTELKKQAQESTFKEEFPPDKQAVDEKDTKLPEASSEQDP